MAKKRDFFNEYASPNYSSVKKKIGAIFQNFFILSRVKLFKYYINIFHLEMRINRTEVFKILGLDRALDRALCPSSRPAVGPEY